jgi:uncharacterized protein
MSAGDLAAALAIGFAAGMSSGMLGIGGGVLFVPGLVIFLGLSQLRAESTSLLAIIPVAVVGAVRQRSYDNVRLREGLAIGILSPAGVFGGAKLSNVIPDATLGYLFAAMLLYFAYTLARRALGR